MKTSLDLKIAGWVVSVLIGTSLLGYTSKAYSKPEALGTLKRVCQSLSDQLKKIDGQIQTQSDENFLSETPATPKPDGTELDPNDRLQQLVEKKQRLLARLDLASYLAFKIDSSFSDKQSLEGTLRHALRDHFLGNTSEDSMRLEKGDVSLVVTLEVQDSLFHSRDGTERKFLDRLEQALTVFGLQ